MLKHTHLRAAFVLLLLVVPQFVFAQANGAYQITVPQQLIMFATQAFSLLIHIMFYAINLLDALLDPQFFNIIMGSTDSSGEMVETSILSLWRFSRDVVNILFALLLVVLALISVVKADLSVIKTNIGKLVAAIILVNFSWFAPRVVIDFANVMTASIYALPNALNSQCVNNDAGQCLMIQNVIIYDEDQAMAGQGGADMIGCYVATLNQNGTNNVQGDSYIVVNDTICIKLAPLPSGDNQLKVFHGLFANYTRIIFAGKLPIDSVPNSDDEVFLKSLGQIVQFFIKLMLNLLLTAAVAFPIIAMAAILLVRLFVMWITIAFMPFAFIGFLVGEKMGEANPMQIWTKFWHNALLPAVLAVPITVGFIILNAVSDTTCPFQAGTKYEKFCTEQSFPVLNINSWWEFILYLFAIVVIYFGFFTATKFDSIAEKIGGFVKGIGDFAMKVPLTMPLPIPKVGPLKNLPLPDTINPLGLASASTNLDRFLDRSLDGSRNQVDGNKIAAIDGNKNAQLTTAISQMKTSATIRQEDIKRLADAFRRANVNPSDATANQVKEFAAANGVSLDQSQTGRILQRLQLQPDS